MSDDQSPILHHTDAVYPGSGSDPVERTVSLEHTELSGDHADRFSGGVPADIHISHPIDSVDEFEHEQHLLAILAARGDGLSTLDNNSGGIEFNEIILSMVDQVLALENVSLSNLDVPHRYVKSFYLYQAHELDSRPAFVEFLEENEKTLHALGFDDVKDQSTFSRWFNRLHDEGLAESVARASTRAVYAVFRYHPELLPETLATELVASPRIDETNISRATEREAIRNWVRYLMPCVLEPFSFDRADNKSLSIEAFFGAIALASAYDTNISQAKQLAGWDYDPAAVPGKSNLSSQISRLDVTELSRAFENIHDRFFDLAGGCGVLDGPLDLVVDVTEIPYWGEATAWTIGHRRANNSSEHFRFVQLLGAENRARFAFGVRPVQSKDMSYSQLRHLLRFASAHTEIGCVLGDREFHSGDAVESIRPFANKNWIIKAGKQSDDIKTLIGEASPGEPERKPNAGLQNVSPSPNAFAVPIPDDSVGGAKRSHEAFITDLPIKQTNLKGLQFKFNNTWNIERGFKQQKADFLPRTNSQHVNYRLFLMNTAMLMYNIHTLINRAVSPELGLRLNVSAQMVLKGVYDVAFS